MGSAAGQRLGEYIREWQGQWAEGTPDFEQFEEGVHKRIMALERELLAEALAGYDVTAEEIEVGGVGYRLALTSSETYLSAAGPITVSRKLYRPPGRGSKSICPLELRAGVVSGYWTPRAARQGAFVLAHLTPGDSEALFAELGSMQPSRATLDRLPKALSAQWEAHRPAWEAALRVQERVPQQARVIAFSVDGAEANWRLLAEVDQACGPPSQPTIEIVGFFHACDHLKEGCDAIWGESTPRSKAEFERLKTLLKEADDGAVRVIRVLNYHRGRAQGRKRQRVEAQLTYFRNQRHRMDYAQYLRDGLPIASGVIEATCKTLVTQRLKQSGMAWTQPGGQAILTFRSLIQSHRWPAVFDKVKVVLPRFM
ncbi:MAG: hypothetical protein L0332_20690 [Chloroflexi bacterium]|nr:hypothetical protein [Chloroflexota bacterium]MCI0729117.1 hypothetical protein [Chloroflexota bacterium]